jgi:hypothetical protein
MHWMHACVQTRMRADVQTSMQLDCRVVIWAISSSGRVRFLVACVATAALRAAARSFPPLAPPAPSFGCPSRGGAGGALTPAPPSASEHTNSEIRYLFYVSLEGLCIDNPELAASSPKRKY